MVTLQLFISRQVHDSFTPWLSHRDFLQGFQALIQVLKHKHVDMCLWLNGLSCDGGSYYVAQDGMKLPQLPVGQTP